MRNIPVFLSLICLFSIDNLSGQSQIFKELQQREKVGTIVQKKIVKNLLSEEGAEQAGLSKDGNAIYFNIDQPVIAEIIVHRPALLRVKIPSVSSGEELTLLLFNKKPFAEGAVVTTSAGDRHPMSGGAYYRGTVEGDEHSVVALSFVDGEMMGVVSVNNRQFDIGKVEHSDVHVIYDATKVNRKAPTGCEVKYVEGYKPDMIGEAQIETRAADKCVNIYFEVSYSIYQNKGSVSAVENYVNGFFNVVSTLYGNENIQVVISEIFVWTSSDPFPTNDAGDALDYFTGYRTSFNGDIAQLLAYTDNGNGGIAWIDVLCNFGGAYSYSYSDIDMTYNMLPNYSWTTNVVTHELGHNLGSEHTHWCGWQGGAIDNCYTTEGGCPPGPPPSNGGTLMSYCHLTGYGINYANGFGPQPGDLLRNKIAQAACLGTCGPQCPTFTIDGAVADVSCFGAADGSIVLIEPNNGTSPFSYTWSNGATTKDVYNLPKGTYSVSITDAAGCPGEASFAITEPAKITLQVVKEDVSCHGLTDGSLIALANGGASGFSYQWSNGATTDNIGNLSAGTYTVTVTDINNCTTQASATITEPAALSLTASITGVSCNGEDNGSITVMVSGGTFPYLFHWNNGSNASSIANLSAGSYTVTVTDSKLCESMATYTITEPPLLNVHVATTDASSDVAADGTAEAIAEGGKAPYSYLWSTGATTPKITGLTAGNYSVTVTDANGCKKVSTITIQGKECLLTVVSSGTSVTCAGLEDGSATAIPANNTGNAEYLWSNGATTQTISGLAPGGYSVIVTDNIGCTATTTITITQPDTITLKIISITPSTTSTSQNGSISIEVTGGTPGYTFIWYSSGKEVSTEQNPSNLNSGFYHVVIKDSHGCIHTSPEIFVDFLLSSNSTKQDPVRIFPNPANGFIYISYIDEYPGDISMYDILGRKVTLSITKEQNNVRLETSSLADGPYIIQIRMGRSVYAARVVVHH